MRQRFYAGFFAAVLLVLAVGLISYQTFKKQNEQAALVKDTYRILNYLELTQKLLIDMETGRRGFRSTNEVKFLEPYYTSLPKIHPTLARLRDLLRNKPEQLSHFEKISENIEDVLAFWKGLGTDASQYTREIIISINDREKTKMDAIRNSIDNLEKLETNNLTQGEYASAQLVKRATYELLISIALILLIVLTLIYMILKEFNTRSAAELNLKNKNSELAEVYKESTERNWVLAGVAEVNNKLQGSDEINQLARSVLDVIVDYVKANAGAFYVLDEEKEVLVLAATNALSLKEKKEFKLHEGLVGQAALKKDLVVITNINPDYPVVQSSIYEARPKEVVYISLSVHDEIKGVIELLSFDSFAPQQLQFLKVVRDNVAVAIESAQSREKMYKHKEKSWKISRKN
jgi:CHASE3 domain sensor protein